jgi:hypothetical protein
LDSRRQPCADGRCKRLYVFRTGRSKKPTCKDNKLFLLIFLTYSAAVSSCFEDFVHTQKLSPAAGDKTVDKHCTSNHERGLTRPRQSCLNFNQPVIKTSSATAVAGTTGKHHANCHVAAQAARLKPELLFVLAARNQIALRKTASMRDYAKR